MTALLPFKIYNTLTRQLEDFKLADAATRARRGYDIGLYLCGITPYGLTHVGNARTMIVFDTFVCFLRAAGYKVKFVRNFTDIDDKIIKRANDENRSAESVSTEFIQAFREDMAGLNVLPADAEPLVSQTLPEITTHIQRLLDRGHAYQAPNGDVLYEVATFKNYGKLANRKLDEQQAGARVEVEPGKKHPFDFVLWKQAKPGEPSWASPWGAGRPGWHIECSAMSCKHLHGDTETFDIHGGGMDLQFPHHECEIAQSEGAYDHTYVNHWMHVAFVNMAGEKMSKSLGNIMTVREALQKFDGRAIRLNMLMTHYRSPVDFSEESIRQAEAALQRIDAALARAKGELMIVEEITSYVRPLPELLAKPLLNDFNTAEFLGHVFGLVKELNGDKASLEVLGHLVSALEVMGMLPKTWPQLFNDDLSPELKNLLSCIDTARQAKDYVTADALKTQLQTEFGGKITITPAGAKWSKN
mgnify:CR=1 FL=1